MKKHNEKFRTIKGFSAYQIGTHDSIRSRKKDGSWFYYTLSLDNQNYLTIRLKADDGKKYNKRLHRIKQETFKPRKNMDILKVLHKNDDKNNNSLNNLMWGTQKQNIIQAYANNKRKNKSTIKRKVLVICLRTEKLFKFNSMTEAAKELNLSLPTVQQCCENKIKRAKGYVICYDKY